MSDGYPQATALSIRAWQHRSVYVSDGYPQATATARSLVAVVVSVRERRLPAGHSCRLRSSSLIPVYVSDGYPQATALVYVGKRGTLVYVSDGYPQATAER